MGGENCYQVELSLIKEFKDINLIYKMLNSLEEFDLLNDKGQLLKEDFYEEWMN